MRELLRHQNRVAVGDGHDFVELVELDDGWNELVRDALDAMLSGLVSGRQGRRLGRFQRMHVDGSIARFEIATCAHHRAPGPNAGDKRRRHHAGG